MVAPNRYDVRLDKTYENLRYEKRLDENLEKPADAKSNLATSNIYVRPPLGLKGPNKEFGMNLAEPGKFDLTDTFFDQKGSLHIVARVQKPKAPNAKKGSNPAEPKVPRGDFTADVIDLLKSAYTPDFDSSKPKTETKSGGGKTVSFKSLDLHPPSKEVKVYIFGEKTSTEQVALIFEYPEGELKNISSKIDLCLGSFRVGEGARRRYSGQDEDSGEGGARRRPGFSDRDFRGCESREQLEAVPEAILSPRMRATARSLGRQPLVPVRPSDSPRRPPNPGRRPGLGGRLGEGFGLGSPSRG